jgi:hypothetical protein
MQLSVRRMHMSIPCRDSEHAECWGSWRTHRGDVHPCLCLCHPPRSRWKRQRRLSAKERFDGRRAVRAAAIAARTPSAGSARLR